MFELSTKKMIRTTRSLLRSSSTPRFSTRLAVSPTTYCVTPTFARLLATANTSSENYAKVYNPNAEKVSLANLDTFARRHIGPTPKNVEKMLKTLGYSNLDEFLSSAVPEHVLIKRKLQIQPNQGFTEQEMLRHLHEVAGKNRIYKSFIGKGYAGTILPPVIQRNLLELPEWYTSYTPYQPEISQGRLQSLLNYQTMITSLTGLDMANASLLDEGTAAAEAMSLSYHHSKNKKKVYVVDSELHPQTIEVIQSRAGNINVEIKELNLSTEDGFQELSKIVKDVCGHLYNTQPLTVQFTTILKLVIYYTKIKPFLLLQQIC